MMVMFTMMTGDGWTFILESLSVSPPHCNDTHARLSNGGYDTNITFLRDS